MKLTWKNRSTRGKTCPSATLSTTNPTRTDPGSNPDLRGEKSATNRLSYGTALMWGLHNDVDGRVVLYDAMLTNNLLPTTLKMEAASSCEISVTNY
jgi:hypothetical protein